MNLWIMPIPPSLANAIAIPDSVTESMLALISGILIDIFRESFVFKSVCDLDTMCDRFGTSKTSSKVSPSLISNIH